MNNKENYKMKGFYLVPVVLTFAVSACSATPPPCPDKGREASVKSAGCIVINDNKLLVIKEMTGKISIPGGSGNIDESPRCSAHRETWEETGLDITPTNLVRKFDNGFHLYRCQLHGTSGEIDIQFTHEVRSAFWLDQDAFTEHRWRFPAQRDWLKDYLTGQN